MTSLTSRVVTRLSALPSSVGHFARTNAAYDYAIGGLPFFSGASKDRPLERATADFRKQQFDTSAEPGEQSLLTWWLRSQSSFHGGAGIAYEEPDGQQNSAIGYRYADSLGVDVWTAGEVSLLPRMTTVEAAAGSSLVMGAIDGGTDIFLQAAGATLYRCTATTAAPVTWGGTGMILSLANDGTNYFAADSTHIYRGTLAGGAGSAIWNTGSANVTLGWVKQRLIAGIGNSLYELDPTGAGGPALPATPKYKHPDPNWRWTSLTETPTAILAAGYSGAHSSVLKLTLEATGLVPELTGAVVTAELPVGELVYAVDGYLGTYVCLGTSKGVRAATVDANGDIQYGPLLVTSTHPVRSLVGRDRYVFATAEALDGTHAGLWRVDLGMSVEFRRFAYAKDLQTHVVGVPRSVTLLGASGRLVVGVDGQGSFIEDATHKEASGFLLTGKIRMHTLEPKLFKYARYRGHALAGAVSMSVVYSDGAETTVSSYGVAGTNPYPEAPIPTLIGQQEYIALRFNFTANADATDGPTMTGYQLKVLPATKRQRLFHIPLLCFDYEKDRTGAASGGEGTAVRRLEALEALEEAGDLVLLQDLSPYPTANRVGVIDQVSFTQADPPTGCSGWGGYLYVTFRSVT